MSIKRHHVGKRLSDMVVHGNTVYHAAQVADDPKADLATQARQVLASIDRLLGEAGSDKTKLLSATIFLPSMADFAAMNSVAAIASAALSGWLMSSSPTASSPRPCQK